MSLLYLGDCLELMNEVADDSVDLIFTDLPYGQVSCEWDKKIDLSKMWEQFMRVKKLHTPIFFCCTTKFGVELIQSAPKKCHFRYDIVWVKSAPAGFLSAKKMPMRKHEMVYVFYEKLPLYDLSSHRHKFNKEVATGELCQYDVNKNAYGGGTDGRIKVPKDAKYHKERYEPPLPVSVVREDEHKTAYGTNTHYHHNEQRNGESIYDPPLPHSLLEIKSERGKHSTQKPTELIAWFLKYYSKEGDVVLDPTMGSGSTGVACKQMNRNFIGMEMNPEIFEVAQQRIES